LAVISVALAGLAIASLTNEGSTVESVAPPAAHAAALWAGLLLLLMLVLAALVTRQRRRHDVMIGDEGVPELVQATRAFGNAAEYAPAGMAALAILAVAGAGALMVHAVGAMLFLGRLAHAWGLSRSGGVSPGRFMGTLLTWLALLVAGALLLFYSVP
jgi:uncharacterized membrane protein YecN with MAPEG domain